MQYCGWSAGTGETLMPSRSLWDNQRGSTVLSGYERISTRLARSFVFFGSLRCLHEIRYLHSRHALQGQADSLYFCSFRPGLHTISTMVRPLPPACRITDTSLLVQSRLGREYFRHCNFNISKLVNTSIQFGSGKMIFHLWPESRRRFLALDRLQVTKISSKLAW